MSTIIESLQQDHRAFEELLKAIENEVAVFEKAERPDYEILEAIVSYFQGYPDSCHHPKEDAILAKLKERNPAAAAAIGDLEADHKKAEQGLAHFTEAVENVLAEVDLPREAFCHVARSFIEHERQHMMMEEQQFFPVALGALSDKDWAELDARLADPIDPLVPVEFAKAFETLKDRVLNWEKEEQASRNS